MNKYSPGMIDFSISSKVLLTKGDVLGISLKSRFMVETILSILLLELLKKVNL